MNGPVPAREAASLILARDGATGVEVLLLERHRGSPMSPGAVAFPGGRVEPADAVLDAARVCRGLTAARAAELLADVRPAERAIGFWVAAFREAFEELGVLLACDADGAAIGPDAAARLRLPEWRARCRREGRAFLELLRAEGLALATDRAAYWAHWITPEERPIRYDTRFFVAAAFPDLAPAPDGLEVVACRWMTPAAALAEHAAGALLLPLPTQRILASVGAQPTVAALLAAAPSRAIRPIRPRIVVADGQERILLPGDPGYF